MRIEEHAGGDRWRGCAQAFALCGGLIAAAAWPMLAAPHERIFGAEIVGRHHDPFTVMRQFAEGGVPLIYWQPLTDSIGAGLAQLTTPVAAYNLLVLASFPLAGAAAYALARHWTCSHRGALVAAVVFAFSPVHVAHASYHVHIAQVQWVPVFLLALSRCVERPSVRRGAMLGAALIATSAASFYLGFICLITAAVAIPAVAVATRRREEPVFPTIAVPAASLAVALTAVTMFLAAAVPSLRDGAGELRYAPGDALRYSAPLWSYLAPPFGHALAPRALWEAAASSPALLEMQVSLLPAIVPALVGICFASGRLKYAVLFIGGFAIACSASPTVIAALSPLTPMFRAYARFGIVAALAAALLAGLGVTSLEAIRTARSRLGLSTALGTSALLLVLLPLRSRDILPTAGHRWLASAPASVRAVDCEPSSPANAHTAWLTRNRIVMRAGALPDCDDRSAGELLAASGYTHIVKRRAMPMFWSGAMRMPLAHASATALVYEVPPAPASVLTRGLNGFHERESGDGVSWRWMGARAEWDVVNRAQAPVRTSLELDLSSFDRPRTLELALDDGPSLRIQVQTQAVTYRVGPFTMAPGTHRLTFHVVGGASVPRTTEGNRDNRALGVRLNGWRWQVAP